MSSGLRCLALALMLMLACQPAGAMLPGPTLLIRCPDTGELRLRHTLLSSSSGAVWFWTDGYSEPNFRGETNISRCGPKGKLYRVDEADVLASTRVGDERGMPQGWHELPAAEPASLRDYREALDSGLARWREEEIEWRQRLWWAANEALRFKNPVRGDNPFARGKPARENLMRLLPLLNADDPHERLLLAETLRALELYDAALSLLKDRRLSDLESFKQIRDLAGRRDALVRPTPTTLSSMREIRARIQASPRR